MPAVVAAILEGMPEPSDLRMHRAGAGASSRAVPWRCSTMPGLTSGCGTWRWCRCGRWVPRPQGRGGAGAVEAYVATLWSTAKRDGSAGVLSGSCAAGSRAR